jgi:hypothetical protein
MTRSAILLGFTIGILGTGRAALADDGIPPAPAALDPSSAVNPTSTVVSGAGIKVGDGTILRPQFGIETGVISNVFYEPDGPVTAGLLRLLVEIGTGSLSGQRLTLQTARDEEDPAAPQAVTAANTGSFQYTADVYATWDQYLSTNDNVTAQGGLGGGLLLRGLVNPQHAVQFGFQDHFSRVLRSTNFESNSATNRDVNELALRLSYVPIGRSLGGYLYYQNRIDVFEASEQQFANRMHNTVGLRVNWQWLPLTRVFGDVSAGYFTGIGSSDKVNSFPFSVLGGIQTALTLHTTLNAHIGYENGFYSTGPSYSSLAAGVLFGYRYSPLGRVTALYEYDHQDSINANFYRDHMFQVGFEQFLVPFMVFAQGELRFREYDGTIVPGTMGNTRSDVIAGANVGMRYSFRDWIAGTLDYMLQNVQTDFRYDVGNGMLADPSFVRHELVVGVRAAY